MHARAISFLCWLGWAAILAGAPNLPVYLEENHAGSFYFLAGSLELEREHTLVLIDAHSDASAAPESDRVRSALRRVVSVESRHERLDAWRRTGRIQANDWIEPLMPRPLARVLWIGEEDQEAKQAEARRFLDGRMEGEPRKCGALGGRFQLVAWDDLAGALEEGQPVVVSLDLDYFSGLEGSAIDAAVHRVVARILSLPGLAAVTVALSRPWLADDAEADRLLGAAIREFAAVRNASVYFEPFADCGPDRTRLARELMAAGSLPPRYRVEDAGADLRAGLLRFRDRLVVRTEPDRWTSLLDRWAGEEAGWFLQADGAQASSDGVVRLDRATDAALRVRGGSGSPVRKVRWFQRKPEQVCYNVLPEVPAGKTFAGVAGGWIRQVDVPVAETEDASLAPSIWKSLASGGLGRVCLWAEIEDGTGIWTTPELDLSLQEGTGFHAGLSGQFGLPYVFGAGFLRGRECDGPETGWGNDCANFLVAAWRRAGRHMPWCNPGQLRRHLVPVGRFEPDREGVVLPAGSVARGVVVHLGNHVAAVWRDVAPLGVLTGDDELAHHLGGLPEVVTLRALMDAKRRRQVEVMMLPEPAPLATIGFGGDVNLAGLAGREWEALETLPEELTGADYAVVNLECVLGEARDPVAKRYRFRAPAKCAGMLRRAGIDAVSLANNHSGDFAAAGMLAMRDGLNNAQVAAAGAGATLEEALAGIGFEQDGLKVAVMCATTVSPELLPAGADQAGVVSLPKHEKEFLAALRRMADESDAVLVFLHWGDEYTGNVTDAQRDLARTIIDAGAAALVGTHSHHPQMTDTWKGRPIIYSLGNLIFPGDGPNPGFRESMVAVFSFGRGGRLLDWQVSRHPKGP